MIGTNELTRTYPRKLAPVAVIPDERAVEVRVHFSTVRWCGGGADGGASCDELAKLTRRKGQWRGKSNDLDLFST